MPIFGQGRLRINPVTGEVEEEPLAVLGGQADRAAAAEEAGSTTTLSQGFEGAGLPGLGEGAKGLLALGLAAAADIFTNIEARKRGDKTTKGTALPTLWGLQQQSELMKLRKEASGREERRTVLAEEAGTRAAGAEKRSAELFPLQKRAAEVQIAQAQIENTTKFLDIFSRRGLGYDAMNPDQQMQFRQQTRAEAETLGINPDIAERALTDPGFAGLIKESLPLFDRALMPQEGQFLLRAFRSAKLEQLPGLEKMYESMVNHAAERVALQDMTLWAKSLGRKPTPEDVRTRFVDSPHVRDAIFQSPALSGLRAEFGIVGVKAAEKAEEQEALLPGRVKEQEALLPGRVKEQEALLPGRVKVARQTGAAAKEVEESIRLNRKIPPDVAALIGLPKGTTIGDAEARGISVPEKKELTDLKALKNFTDQGRETVRELDRLITTTPEAIGRPGRVVTMLAGLQANAENIARLAGIRVEASLNPKDYAGTFRGVGIDDARIQANVIALAFPLAAAAQGASGGGRLSDKDVEFQIRRIGANAQDPVAFRATLADVELSLSASFTRAIETATGFTPTTRDDAGQPPADRIERMSVTELKDLDVSRLNAEQRKALDRALRRHGF